MQVDLSLPHGHTLTFDSTQGTVCTTDINRREKGQGENWLWNQVSTSTHPSFLPSQVDDFRMKLPLLHSTSWPILSGNMKGFVFGCCLLFGLFTLAKSGVVNNTLKCYQCEIRGTDETACDEKQDLKLCPSIQAYDRCLTNFRKNDSGHFIIKKCALAPCEFKTYAENTIFSTSCQLDWSSADCAKCCQGDGCNWKNMATSFLHLTYPNFIFITGFSGFIIFFNNLLLSVC